MSQESTVQQVVPKMRHPHPAAAAAQQFRQETAHLRAGEPAHNAAPINQPVAPAPMHNMQYAQPAPVQIQQPIAPPPVSTAAPVSGAPLGQPVVQPVQQPVQAPLTPVQNIPLPPGYVDILATPTDNTVKSPVQTTQPVPPVFDEEQYKRRFAAENADLIRQLEDTRQQLTQKQELSEELQRLKDEKDLDALIASSGVEFSSIDPADARKLMTPVLTAMRKQQAENDAAMKRQLQQQEETITSRLNLIEEQEQKQKVERTRQAILSVHPDLEELQKTAAYHSLMLSPISEKSGLLVGQLVAAEFQKGNAPYVIDVLNRLKGTQPSLEAVTSVSPSTTGTAFTPGADAADGMLSYEQIAQMKLDVQQGNMTREAFRTAMDKHRAAKKVAPTN